MWVKYFIHQGKRYEYGTIVKINTYDGEKEMTFINYNPEKGQYLFKVDDTWCKEGYKFREYNREALNENLIEITDKIDTIYVKNHPIIQDELTFTKELRVDGLLLAWVWYIFLMGITLIFNGRLFYWAVISFVFFIYRYGKLKEEGYK